MKLMLLAALTTAVFLSTSCVTALNTPYCESDLILDRSIVGTWVSEDETESWQFTASDDKGFRVAYTDENGKTGHFKAYLFMIGTEMFLDMSPADPEWTGNEFYKSHFAKLHTVIHLTRANGSFRVAFLEEDWLRAYLLKQPASVAHVVIDGSVILTDSTKKIQTFITASLKTPGAFSPPTTMIRRDKR